MGTFFAFLYKHIRRFRYWALMLLIAFVAVSGWYASQIKFTEDITRIFPANKAVGNMNFVYNNSKFLDKVVFMISLRDSSAKANPEMLTGYTARLVDSLNRLFVPGEISTINTGPDNKQITQLFDEVYQNLPLFLDSADYSLIDSMVTDSAIKITVGKDYQTLLSPAGFAAKAMIKKDPLNITFIALNKFKNLQITRNFELYNNYILTRDRRYLLFFITPAHPSETAVNQKLFEKIDKLLPALDNSGEISVSYFGSAVVAAGNARQIKSDIILTVTIAAIALILLISLFFRNWRSFFLIMLPVLFGALTGLAGLVLFEREVSAISLGIGSVLLGISVDFALHIYAHYRRFGNAADVLKKLSTPVILSSFTTASAFLSLLLINSKVLNDLGIFAAISVISAAMFTLLVLPHLFSARRKQGQTSKVSFINKLAAIDLSGKKPVIWGVVVITVVFAFLSHKVMFNADMTSFNYMDHQTAKAEKLLKQLTGTEGRPVFIVATGKNLDEAFAADKKVKAQLSLLEKEGVLPQGVAKKVLFMSEEEQRKAIDRWNMFWKDKKERVLNSLIKYGKEYHFKAVAFNGISGVLNKKWLPVSLDSLPVVKSIFEDNLIETDTLSAVLNVIHVPLSKLPAIEEAFQNNHAVWIINRQRVTEQLVSLLKDNLNKLVGFSILIIFLILIIAYGRIELTLITMTPVLMSWLWVTGIMALTGISFNIFNIIIITFVFGLGIDYSIFLMRGMLIRYKTGGANLAAYRVSILLSVITTLLGIGVLIFAKHPALRSIALMSIIGILTVIFVTFTIEPLLFRWLTTYSKGKRKRPVTGLDFVFSVWSGILFIGGGAILSFVALILSVIPGKEPEKKLFFHKLLKYSTGFLISSNFLTPKRYINTHGEDFSKPAIIIANHQSHIDLMILLLQTHKVAVFTNEGNYNNKVYGRALKYAGFIPAYTGHQDALERLKELVAEGYSLAVFPEGHRSDDGKIRRFHKGAFYLARELQLDIIPMIIHGPNELLKKSELFLKRGKITVKIYPRINVLNDEWGSDLREKKHNIQQWFRGEYAGLKEAAETPKYLSDFIIKNFIYKGPVLEWYTKVKIRLENQYRFFDDIIPRKAVITDLGCGYGYLDFMLSLRSEERIIHGFDYDGEKIKTASNCAIANKNIKFEQADITTIEPAVSDVFVLNDVLHYLVYDQQVKIINRCMEKLNTNGIIILRDGNREYKNRHRGTRLTELFSTNLGFNKAENRLEFISESMIKEITEAKGFTYETVDTTKLTSNIIFLIRKKQ
jgi:1-acyl-sn-glycerol-3-phosphate acyltransferase